MLKLTQRELSALTDTASAVSQMFAEIETLTEAFRADLQRISDDLDEAKETARGIMEDAANAAEEYYDEKSEKWQDSDRGTAYAEWRDRLLEIAQAIGEPLELPAIEIIDAPEWLAEIADQDFSEFNY